MVACHRGRLECARALLRAGADPNWQNGRGDFTLFWAIDGGVDMIKLLHRYSADLDVCNAKGWTPLSYAKAKGKYGATEEKGIYPEVGWHEVVHGWHGQLWACEEKATQSGLAEPS